MRKAGILLLLFLFGCSGNKLDQATAEGLATRFSIIQSGRISQMSGRVGTHCPYLNDKGQQAELPLDLTPQSQPTSVFAEMAGYVTVNADGDGYWKVACANPGKKIFQESGRRHVSDGALNGCDYETDFLNVAVPELVRVTAVTPGEGSTEIAFVWKWKVTDLGRELRQDGKLYSMLAPAQREELRRDIRSGFHRPSLPLPGDGFPGLAAYASRKTRMAGGPRK